MRVLCVCACDVCLLCARCGVVGVLFDVCVGVVVCCSVCVIVGVGFVCGTCV